MPDPMRLGFQQIMEDGRRGYFYVVLSEAPDVLLLARDAIRRAV